MTSFHEQIPNAFEQNNRLSSWTRNIDGTSDRLALQRAQHFESRSRSTRPKSITSNEDISDWSESDRECAPLSDYESSGPYSTVASNSYNYNNNNNYNRSYIDDDNDDQIDDEIPEEVSLEKKVDKYKEEILENIEKPNDNNLIVRTINNKEITNASISSLNVSKTKDNTNRKLPIKIPSIITDKKFQPQIHRTSTNVDFCVKQKLENKNNERKLKIRENDSKHSMTNVLKTVNNTTRRSSIRSGVSLTNSQLYDSSEYHHKTILNNRLQKNPLNEKLNKSSSRLLRRDRKDQRYHQHMKDTTIIASPNSSFLSHEKSMDGIQQQRTSPNYSLNSTVIAYSQVPKAYELKKLIPDTYDWGRVTDTTTSERVPCNRQKWGTIVHPPFPLGYQRATYEQVVDVVERLNSPMRCKHSHTPSQSPSKKYLSVEETDALINRLTKVKSIRRDEYYSKGNNMSTVKKMGVLDTYAWKSHGITT
ncbi:unnamed protein product [Didymodactylos carnosus]|uniref:Uncharacterized protein n=1 Tax=Didymodactylos carnosus TaxID=1234261 RepID=A0A813XV33_9BILA|nr:unnamed protein product [Didymodactylos carnosus]CAF1160866.1 unnamed protein product [Didymodactylos carnosus]CAF3662813.1 unnamed protein product [Didymodactylos carnosus]CAF3972656.1 unnamed protein product [Didymodactylos carnosus]